jgi:hypothetical protein
MDSIPIWALLSGTVIGLVVVIEIGFRLGSVIHRHSEDEKESPVGAISAATLGLLAFMLAFTFSITTDRYEARKTLVREEANAIGTMYLRTDFLAEPDRTESRQLLRQYLDDRVSLVQKGDVSKFAEINARASQIQRRLWEMAVTNARKDLNSDIGALYIESLNQVIDIHALRVTVGFQTRIPSAIWIVLYVLVFFGMVSIGYQTGIAGSRRSLAALILAVSFGLVLSLIVMLDRPTAGAIAVSQQPLINARAAMDTPSK